MFNKYFKPILILSVLVILAVAYFVFLSPLMAKRQELSESVIKNKRDELQKTQLIHDGLSQLTDRYSEIDEYLVDKVLNILPSSSDLPNLYYTLEQLASNANYRLLSTNVSLPSDKNKSNAELDTPIGVDEPKKIKRVDIILNLEGSGYSNLKKFIDSVENNLRLFDIKSVSYDPAKITISINLVGYYYE